MASLMKQSQKRYIVRASINRDILSNKQTWSQHLQRNQSIIVDLFHGLLKSTITCEKCKHQSVKFEPFTFLNLPLPINKLKNLTVIVYKLDNSIPVQYGLTVEHTATVHDVKTEISKVQAIFISNDSSHISQLSGIPTDKMVVVDVCGGYIFNVVADLKGLGGLTASDIRIFEVCAPVRQSRCVRCVTITCRLVARADI